MAKVGKVLLLLAGLVAMLDLAGRERLEHWAERAAKRHSLTVDRLRRKRRTRWLRSIPQHMYSRAMLGRAFESDPYFTSAEFAAFARQIRAMRGPHPTEHHFESFGAYQARQQRGVEAKELIRSFFISRISEEERIIFDAPLPRDSRRRHTIIMSAVCIGALVMSVWMGLGLPAHLPWIMKAALISMSFAMPIVLAEGFYDDISEYAAIALLAVETSLAHAALWALGPKKDGHRLRWAALGAFMAGSLLDLLSS